MSDFTSRFVSPADTSFVPKEIDRFLSRFRQSGESCWEWLGSLNPSGYGTFYRNTKARVQLAHRFSYSLFIGPIPQSLHVLHKCDNRKCVNPSHLFLGTNNDNIADRMKKGRRSGARGDANAAKLYPERLHRGDDHHARKHPECMARGERNGRSKLTINILVEIKSMRGAGLSYYRIGKLLGLNPCTVSRAIRGLTWKHVA